MPELASETISKSKVAGIVVLYNAERNILQVIDTYINQVDKLYIVDNSPKSMKNEIDLLLRTKNIKYIYNNGNIGIAEALNIGAKFAIKENYEYLLTMDQDTEAVDGMVEVLLKEMSNYSNVGIISPIHVNKKYPKFPNDKSTKSVYCVMTCGNIVNLNAYKKAKGFNSDLFIDYVDHEFCLRLKSMNYKILQVNSVILLHNLGNVEKKRFLFHDIYATNHSPLRLYYRTRNRFYVRKEFVRKFPKYFFLDNIAMLKELFKILFFEKKTKAKFHMILKGYWDYRKKKFGKYPYISH